MKEALKGSERDQFFLIASISRHLWMSEEVSRNLRCQLLCQDLMTQPKSAAARNSKPFQVALAYMDAKLWHRIFSDLPSHADRSLPSHKQEVDLYEEPVTVESRTSMSTIVTIQLPWNQNSETSS